MGNVCKGLPEAAPLLSHDGPTAPCPTCRGSGHVPFDSESSYIALIPLTDYRLRPQHTIFKILATILLCVILSAFFLFFLLPRSIELTSHRPLLFPSSVTIGKDTIVSLNVSNFFNFTNWNYVPVHVQDVTILSLYREILISSSKLSMDTWVPMRSMQEFNIPLQLDFKLSVFDTYLAALCLINNTEFNRIYMNFDFSIQALALGQKIESSLDTFQLVSCYTNSTPFIPITPQFNV